MELLLKSAAVALVTTILSVILGKHSKESATAVCIVGCCLIISAVVSFLEPTLDFVDRLQNISTMDLGVLEILLKSTGIAILSEIVSLICTDAGNAALGKTLQLLATAVILWLSLPLLNRLIELVESILVAI